MVVMDGLLSTSSSRDRLFSSPGGAVRSSGSVASQLRYISDELGQTHAEGALLSSGCRAFNSSQTQTEAKRRPYSALRSSPAVNIRDRNMREVWPFSHFEPLLRAQGVFLRGSVLFLTAAGTLAPSAGVSMSVMGNSREKTWQQPESH